MRLSAAFTLSVVLYLSLLNATLAAKITSNSNEQFVIRKEGAKNGAISNKKNIKLQQDSSSLETQALEYTVEIDTHYAITTVVSRLWNDDYELSEEAQFSVKLPDGAFITDFRMIVDEEIFVGVVLQKEQAEEVYNEAVAAGQNAGLVSEKAENEFGISSNVAPRSSVIFELTYEQLLERRLSWYEYDLHILSAEDESIVECHGHYDCGYERYCDLFKSCFICYDCPLYMDAIDFWCPPCYPDVIIEPLEPLGSVVVKIFVTEEDGFQAIEAPLPVNPEPHIESVTSKRLQIQWPPNAEAVPLGEDISLTLRYQVNPPKNDAGSLITDSRKEFFVHLFSPPDLGTFNKAMVFILDRSGSMTGRKFEQLQEAVVLIIETLTDQDYMNFIFFDSDSEAWMDELVLATEESKTLAIEFVSTMTPGGSTGINEALLLGISLLEQSEIGNEYAPQIIFLTDGLANVGEASSEGIRANVREANDQEFSIYSLGLGDNLDYELLRGLSLENNGFDRRISEDDNVVASLELFYDEIDSTVMSNIEMLYTIDSSDCCLAEEVTKNTYQRLFDNSEVVVAGRLPDGATSVIASARGIQSNGTEIIFTGTFNINEAMDASELRGSNVPVQQIWAFLTLQDIETKIEVLSGVSGNEDEIQQLNDEALQISLEYNFVTEYTSLVVVPDICSLAEDVEGCARDFNFDIPGIGRDFGDDGSADEDKTNVNFNTAFAMSSASPTSVGGAAQSGAAGPSGAPGSTAGRGGLYIADAVYADYDENSKPTQSSQCQGDFSISKIERSCDNIHIKLCSTHNTATSIDIEIHSIESGIIVPLQDVSLEANSCSKNLIISCESLLIPETDQFSSSMRCDIDMELQIEIDTNNDVCEEDESNNVITKVFGEQLCDGLGVQSQDTEDETSFDDESPPSLTSDSADSVPVPAPAPDDAGVCQHEHGSYEGAGLITSILDLSTPGNCCVECLRTSECLKWEFMASNTTGTENQSICILRRDGIPVPDELRVRKVEEIL